MFDGFMSPLIDDLARMTTSRDETAVHRRVYGVDTPVEHAQQRRTRTLFPRFPRRKTADSV